MNGLDAASRGSSAQEERASRNSAKAAGVVSGMQKSCRQQRKSEGRGNRRATHAVIYDAECGLCRRAADWVVRNVPAGTIELVPCASEKRARRFPQVSREACMAALHVVTHDGAVLSGEKAVACLLRRADRRRWRWLGRALGLPGARLAARAAYRFIAGRRGQLSTVLGTCTVHKDAEGAGCS